MNHASSRRRRFALSRITAAVVGSLTLCLLGAAPASAAPTPVTFLQFNMCGADCAGGGEARANELTQAILSQRPTVVSLNEACRADLVKVQNALSAAGYAMNLSYRASIPGGRGGCAGSDYGNALLTKSPPKDVDTTTFTAQAGGIDRRGMVCVLIYQGTNIRVCSTHLLAGNAGLTVRDAQVVEVLKAVAKYTVPVVLLGDFNEWPAGRPLDRVFAAAHGGASSGAFLEAGSVTASGHPCRCGAATAGSTKLDYVFLQASRWTPVRSGVTAATTSDHRMLWATASLR